VAAGITSKHVHPLAVVVAGQVSLSNDLLLVLVDVADGGRVAALTSLHMPGWILALLFHVLILSERFGPKVADPPRREQQRRIVAY
jgi:hypothetical protein